MPRRSPLHQPLPWIAAAFVLAGGEVHANTAFRFSTLVLRDPHTYAFLPFLGCRDITDTVPLGLGTPFNGMLENSIQSDGNGDGSLDLNALVYFAPEDVAVGTATLGSGTQWDPADADGELFFHFGSCTPPFSAPICVPDLSQTVHQLEFANEEASPCLEAIPGTLNDSYTSPTWPGPPCFVTEPFDMVLEIGGIPVPLNDVQFGATYPYGVSVRLVDGVIRGFLREAAADSVILPESLSIVGGQPLATLLPGGSGSCTAHDDRDVHQGQTGWWVYLDFDADEVPFTPSTTAPERTVSPRGGDVALEVAPNPFAAHVVFDVLASAASARLDVYDVRGRPVRSLGRVLRGGRDRVTWDGTDARGRSVPPGVYFVRLDAGGRAKTCKVVRVDRTR